MNDAEKQILANLAEAYRAATYGEMMIIGRTSKYEIADDIEDIIEKMDVEDRDCPRCEEPTEYIELLKNDGLCDDCRDELEEEMYDADR